MFNPLRLFRRKDHIDDLETAYIEGRTTAADDAELESRLVNEPGLRDELESLKATVSLLRSVEPVRAPRSFALAEAPVRVRRRSGQRLAMAPAVLAIAAAAGVGLLAVGNLADFVSQSDSSSSSAERSSLITAKDEVSQTEFAGETAIAESSLTPYPSPTPGPIGTLTSSTEFAPLPTESGQPEIDNSRLTDVNEIPDGALGTLADPDSIDGSDIQNIVSDSADFNESTSASARPGGDGAETDQAAPPVSGIVMADDSGVELPLWQLQLALAAIAAAMVGLWMFMRRRASV